jgi:hypothetical protein
MATAAQSSELQSLDLIYATEELARLTSLADGAAELLRQAFDRVSQAEALAAEFEKAEFGFLSRGMASGGERFATEEQITELECLTSGFENEMDHVERWPIERASEAARDAFSALESMHANVQRQILRRLNGSGGDATEQESLTEIKQTVEPTLAAIATDIRDITSKLRGEPGAEGDDG